MLPKATFCQTCRDYRPLDNAISRYGNEGTVFLKQDPAANSAVNLI